MTLNAQSLNAVALNQAPPALAEGRWEWRLVKGGLGAGALNARPLNGGLWRHVWVPGETVPDKPAVVLPAEFELREVYLLEVGDYRVPMSSFQATMRKGGKSFLQAVIPNALDYLAAMTVDAPMRVLMGLVAPDGELSGLEEIAAAPLQIIRHDEGSGGNTMTISGYAAFEPPPVSDRHLVGVSYRSVTQGRRRIRCQVDLKLRPGHIAVDREGDGDYFYVADIQYYVGPTVGYMEVVEDNG